MLNNNKKYVLLKASSLGVLAMGLLTGCSLGKNPNTKTTVISQTVISDSEQSSDSTTVTTSETNENTSYTISETTTTTTTTTIVDNDVFVNSNKYDKTVSEWLELICIDHTIEEVNKICDSILENANKRGEKGADRGTYSTAALLAKKCLSEDMAVSIEKALSTNHISSLNDMNITDEEKKLYDYMYKLYKAYLNAVENKNAYLMIYNGGTIFDNMKEFESVLLKNKITDQERLNYFLSYSNGKIKESNLFLGESLLRDYFEEMRYYVTEEDYTEFFDWSSTSYAVENVFAMLEESFMVEWINGKYVALKAPDMVFTTEPVVTTTISDYSNTTTTITTNTTESIYTTGVVEQHSDVDFIVAPNGELWVSEDEYYSWYGTTKQSEAPQKKLS